jgi:hypothetical protein
MTCDLTPQEAIELLQVLFQRRNTLHAINHAEAIQARMESDQPKSINELRTIFEHPTEEYEDTEICCSRLIPVDIAIIHDRHEKKLLGKYHVTLHFLDGNEHYKDLGATPFVKYLIFRFSRTWRARLQPLCERSSEKSKIEEVLSPPACYDAQSYHEW